MHRQRLTAVVLLVTFAASVPLVAIDGDKAAYAGGTYLPYVGKDDIEGKLNIKADLCYHSFSQAFVDHLLGKNAPKVPTVIMTSLSGQIEVALRGLQGGK